jgi:aspartate-semialdehyde dehydrogenase
MLATNAHPTPHPLTLAHPPAKRRPASRAAHPPAREQILGYRIVVVGATGNVGREMLNILAEREFPIDEIAAVASPASTGSMIEFGDTDRMLKCHNLEHFDFTGWDIALFAAGSGPTRIHAPRAAASGCTVIDNSSLYRMEPDVPLIVPEVNGDAIDGYAKRNIIANPNCSTAQMVVALNPLHQAATIRRVVVATYQSVSGAGKAGMDELFEQTRAVFVGDTKEPKTFTRQIAFNLIPHIDVFMDASSDYDGYTKEEWKMAAETARIMGPDVLVTATCVRVPVFVGHSEAITIELEQPLSAARAQAILREAPGVMLVDKREDGGYVTPVECVGDYATFVSRVRRDPTVQNGLSLWCVSDNLRKGAALNAVQIAELLGRRHLKKG